jgi:NADH-ubiquinone oxidoreductase chain 5
MTGFYSKDFILESAYGQYYLSSNIVYYIAVIGAMFTLLYSVKVIYLTFITNPNGPLINYKHAHEGTIYMSIPLIILAVFSIYFGYLTKDIYLGLGTSFYIDNSIFIHPNHDKVIDTEFSLSILIKFLPLISTITLTIISLIIQEYYLYNLIKFKYSKIGYNIYSFFNLKYLIELIYNLYVVEAIFKLGGQTVRYLDKGSVELIGP